MTTKYFVAGLLTEVKVEDANNKLYRHARKYYNDFNYPTHITRLAQYVNDKADSAITTLKYDRAGNITNVVLPSKMAYTYTYDNRYNMYVTQVKDTFGYTYKLENYDYRYGKALKTTDINGNVMLSSLDNRGRVTSVTGPNELANGKPYTIKFEYFPENMTKNSDGSINNPAYALTRHYDPANSTANSTATIETVNFVDGFGRSVQLKKDGFVGGNKVLLVNGKTVYDGLGRVIESYYPSSETDLSKKFTYSPAPGSNYKTLHSYDALDRLLNTTLPDNTRTRIDYSIAEDCMVTLVTDAKGGQQASYNNGSGKTVKTVQYSGPDGEITTRFAYDAIDQLIQVTDTKGSKTTTSYDLAGRPTQWQHPASGVTRCEYDAAGNMVARQTANLIKENKRINYTYDFNRLTAIHYPNHPENDVKYSYGAVTDVNRANNRIGRLIYQEDGSGAQAFKYGKMGELTEVQRTLIIPNQAVASYTSTWTYDSWNRLQTMTYPDGEVLRYSYNSGGQLCSLKGTKNNVEYPYISNIAYDEFEQRTQLTYGNGAVTNYAYKPNNRMLDNLQVKVGNAAIMDNKYEYDEVGNVASINNSAATASGRTMVHIYSYDGLNRLTSAVGRFTGAGTKKAEYSLDMTYDNLHNITAKYQYTKQTDMQFAGTLTAAYNLTYNHDYNPQQISTLADVSYRFATGESSTPESKAKVFSYDANGNMLCINSGTFSGKTLNKTNERRMLWDEENRMLALSDNGYVSNYWYDAAGERSVKQSGDGQAVSINGALSGAHTGTANFTAYISPYTVVNNGGQMSKHIYIGSQRVLTKLIDAGTMADPTTAAKAGSINYSLKYSELTDKIKVRYDSLGVTYRGKDNAGIGFYKAATATGPETQQYYYHSDHLGSSSLITDAVGGLVQHLEYLPFGSTFIDERCSLSSWHTPFGFNGKERDEETGLLYVSKRYQDGELGIWLSVDPLAAKYPGVSAYAYCLNNPLKYIDTDGRWPKEVHHELLDKAFNSKSPFAKIITPVQLEQLKKGSDNADGVLNGNQNDNREYIHGMKPKDMSVSEAKKSSDNWIKDNIDEFVKTGDFEKLGEALHTIEDETCPTHRDENGTPLEFNGVFSGHLSKENPDNIKKNNGKNGYITLKDRDKRYNKAEIKMQATLKSALKQRADYLKTQEKQNKK